MDTKYYIIDVQSLIDPTWYIKIKKTLCCCYGRQDETSQDEMESKALLNDVVCYLGFVMHPDSGLSSIRISVFALYNSL
jgi:hypothetical protein